MPLVKWQNILFKKNATIIFIFQRKILNKKFCILPKLKYHLLNTTILCLYNYEKKILLLLLLLISFEGNSQKKNIFGCGTDDLHFYKLKTDNTYLNKFERQNNQWQNYVMNKTVNTKEAKSTTQITTLTIVFHDISSASTFLLSNTANPYDYQYIIDKINLIYNGTNLNGTTGVDTNIQFCLALYDDHTDSYTVSRSHTSDIPQAQNLDKSDFSQIEAITGAVDLNFSKTRYIHVYVVDSISGDTAGFATFPSDHGSINDGIFIERQYLINDSNINLNINVLAHEMGHYLGLFHTFGICDPATIESCSCNNDNCLFNGDMVCDTPPNQLQTSAYSLGNFPNTCDTDAIPHIINGSNVNPITSDMVDPKENYMDYGIEVYKYTFSLGQAERMNFMINPIKLAPKIISRSCRLHKLL